MKVANKKLESCTCSECVEACKTMPGGLIPSDVKPIADFLGISEKELIQRYLVIDYWYEEVRSKEFLRPNKIPETARSGEQVSWGWGFTPGRCVFLDKTDRCTIHPVKPWNCRQALACSPNLDGLPEDINQALAEAWAGIDIWEVYALDTEE